MGDEPQGECDTLSVGCNDVPCMSTITCKSGPLTSTSTPGTTTSTSTTAAYQKTGADSECTCEDCENDQTRANCPEDLSDLTFDSLDSAECKKKCEEQDQCKYFRWEKTTEDTHCTLMNDAQCQEFLPCLDESHCVSGQVDCALDEQRPPGTDCKRMTAADFSVDPGAVHWTCVDQYNPTEFINIYGAADADATADVPSSTICWTAKRCINFDTPTDKPDDPDEKVFHRQIVVQCNDPTAEENKRDGKWVQGPDSNNDIATAVDHVDTANNKLNDVRCLPKNLALDASALNEVGVSFICEKLDEEHYEIKDHKIILKQYNKCILLCNFHHVATIEPKFIEEPVWWKFPPGEEDGGEEAKESNVKCW